MTAIKLFVVITIKQILAPFNLDFEKVKAAIEPIIIDPVVVTTVISKVLNKYLEIGICRLLNNAGKTL